MSEQREVTVLGSTGSIGRQAITVAGQNPDRLRITALAAGGGDVTLLAEQALALGVRTVAVARATAAQDLQLAFYAAAQQRGWARGEYALPEILAGPRAAEELAARPADVVLNGITGSIGLGPTLSALRAGTVVALANKESLVAGGDLVTAAAAPGQLVPVDSEHSALAQCLRGGRRSEVARLVLTASGGPFRGKRRADLAGVTVEQAMAHPTWSMGP
ncbi:MAG TPA: 1-deoxy-D-xylulose-5-phosphate reductoisomerase, partial [Geodermatophilus sp.]|nr:1-deoxy-D-xylulose-5-phosphate reductoisomerase [Geodermatophilus sp.]